MDIKKAAELLKKGFILTKEHCPNCGAPLLKDKRTGSVICVSCGFKKIILDERTVLENKKAYILSKISEEEDPKNLYLLLKCLKIIKEIEKKYL